MQAHLSSALNPRLPMLFRVITSVEWLVLGVTGSGLFLLPTVASAQWPWQVTPFNTYFLAAVYISSFAAVTVLLWGGHWAPARVGLWMLLVFTTLVLIISVLYLDRFDFHKWATWAWFFLYIVIPLNSVYNLYLYRRLQPVNPTPLPSLLKWYLLVQAVALSLYTLALLLAPVASTAFWPWHVDEFQANASRQTVNWTQPGTWVWIGLLAVLMLTGIVMIVLALGKRPLRQQG